MSKLIVVLFMVVFLFCGCMQIAEYAEEIGMAGKGLESAGTVVTAFRPEIGILVVLSGGLLVAIGKMLSKKKEQKQGE